MLLGVIGSPLFARAGSRDQWCLLLFLAPYNTDGRLVARTGKPRPLRLVLPEAWAVPPEHAPASVLNHQTARQRPKRDGN